MYMQYMLQSEVSSVDAERSVSVSGVNTGVWLALFINRLKRHSFLALPSYMYKFTIGLLYIP